ncbi:MULTISPECIES: amino acid ABC transporter permease [Arthrobacter]|uniref:Amino acid ABC transporter permease n=2 Tax=Arthrobacter TaxID=1663 RepID=A0ABU9KHB8_9MICC|nr:amino acid ABC transporter permease [Arthrobacter sp. YJM1]MDP5226265.1 amino acid ABC transporter permease [Arthrobacter sp. YJM1]
MSSAAPTAPTSRRAAAVASAPDDDVVAIPLRHPWRWVVATVLGLSLVWLIYSMWTNPNISHQTVTKYLFNPRIVNGVLLSILITVIAMLVSTVLGVFLAIMRLAHNPVMNFFAWLYVWVFRGTPLLIQIVFWGYLGLLYQQITLGVPFTDFTVFSVDTNTLVPAFTAGLLALTLNQAAYSAEIIRGGMLSVDPGQTEAAASLGMSPAYTLFKVILPQATRVIIPPMGNETISMLKQTSLLSVIAVLEVYTVATQISSQNLRQVELLLVVSCWYLFLTSVLSVPQYYLERHFGRGNGAAQAPTPLGRLAALLRRAGVLKARPAVVRPTEGGQP